MLVMCLSNNYYKLCLLFLFLFVYFFNNSKYFHTKYSNRYFFKCFFDMTIDWIWFTINDTFIHRLLTAFNYLVWDRPWIYSVQSTHIYESAYTFIEQCLCNKTLLAMFAHNRLTRRKEVGPLYLNSSHGIWHTVNNANIAFINKNSVLSWLVWYAQGNDTRWNCNELMQHTLN